MPLVSQSSVYFGTVVVVVVLKVLLGQVELCRESINLFFQKSLKMCNG